MSESIGVSGQAVGQSAETSQPASSEAEQDSGSSGIFGISYDKIAAKAIDIAVGFIPVAGTMATAGNLLARGLAKTQETEYGPNVQVPTIGSTLVEAIKAIGRGDVTPDNSPAFGSADKAGAKEGGNAGVIADAIASDDSNTFVPKQSTSYTPKTPSEQPDSSLTYNPFAPKLGIFDTKASVWFS